MATITTDSEDANWTFRRFETASYRSPRYDPAMWEALKKRLKRAKNGTQEVRDALKEVRRLFEEQGAPRELREIDGVVLTEYKPLRCTWLWNGAQQICLKDSSQQIVCDDSLTPRILESLSLPVQRDHTTKRFLVNTAFGYGFCLEDGPDIGLSKRRRVLLAPELEELFEENEHPFVSIAPHRP